MRASAVQLNSNETSAQPRDRGALSARGAEGAELVVLPEKFNVLGSPEQLVGRRRAARRPDAPLGGRARRASSASGSSPAASSSAVEGDDKLRNTSVLFGPDGDARAVYRKIHMFDVEVGGIAYRESDVEAPGDEIVVADAGELKLGLAVCYDLRFPELFRIMAVRGARAFSLPAAFTVPTGRAHWEVLVRARAIENQAFVIAAGQVGTHPPDHESYGHSMIVDPWGTVLARAADEPESVVVADLDLDAQDGRPREAALAREPPARPPTAGPSRRSRRSAMSARDGKRATPSTSGA